MNLLFFQWAISVAIGLFVIALVRLPIGWERVPLRQAISSALVVCGAMFFGGPLLLFVLPVVWGAPPLLAGWRRRRYKKQLDAGLDPLLTALADALTTVPNLAGALESLIPNIEEPMKSEVKGVLSEVKLGKPIDDALEDFGRRVGLPGLDAAVGAALLGKRTGGDLSAMLRRIAATGREMKRLEGVLATKTAEGRSQAWVMGSVPPVLILILEWVNPDWLAPLFSDPIGWGLLGVAVVAEGVAILLIRKIMTVEI